MKMIVIAALLAIGPSIPACGTAAGPCCRVCVKGKACGDSCIARDKTCHKAPGCACNG